MSTLPQSSIKEIAKEMVMGNTCFIHRYTGMITIIDKSITDIDLLVEQVETQKELELKIGSYVKIDKLSSEDQFLIMNDFLDDLADKSVRKQLANAIKRQNPVRNFHQVIEGNMELELHWGNFKRREYERWVSEFLVVAFNN